MAEIVRIEGLAALNRALAELPKNIGKNVLRGAVRAGAAVVRDEVKLQAPVRTGQLRRAVYLKQIGERSGPTRQVFYVGVRQGKQYQAGRTHGAKGSKVRTDRSSMDAFYARFLEFGTSKMAAQPFMRPAWQAKQKDALAAITNYIRNRLPQEAAKLPKR